MIWYWHLSTCSLPCRGCRTVELYLVSLFPCLICPSYILTFIQYSLPTVELLEFRLVHSLYTLSNGPWPSINTLTKYFRMRFLSLAGTCLMAFVSTSIAEKIPKDHYLWGPQGAPTTIEKRQATSTTATPTSTRAADAACTNGPLTRQCWSNGFSAATDFDAKWPTTGKTVTYNFEITNSTCNPDGNGAKPCQLVNGVYPGPTISASESCIASRRGLYSNLGDRLGRYDFCHGQELTYRKWNWYSLAWHPSAEQ